MLLGGVNDQYQRLYERAIDVAKEQLLFRPMLPDNRDILLSGNLLLSDRADERLFIAEGAHLSCFVGGMLAIAAQIFQRPADLATAAKLADGCVWAYEATRTGIMPESFVAVPCADAAHCRWNETRYMEAVYAFRAYGNLDAAYPQKDVPPPPTEQPPTQQQQQQQQQQRPEKDYVRRRQRRHAADAISVASRPLHATLPKSGLGALEAGSDDPLSPSSLYSPTQEPPTLEDYARGIIKEDRLPPGMVGIPMKGYALR
jgi:mannosyl-oligosaccharide alpha-1,2-mannosidase